MNKTVIAIMLAASFGVQASPGDDGCIGNCGGSDGGTSGNSTSSVGNISNGNTNTNAARALAGANSRANSNASSNSKSVGVGFGMGGNANSNANATGGRASSSSFNSNVAKGGTAIQGQVQGQDQANVQGTEVIYNEAKQDFSDTYEDYTPGANAYAANPTATCVVTGGVAVGIPGFAGSASAGVTDEVCQRLEMIRSSRQDPSEEVRELGSTMMQKMLVEELAEMQKEEDKEAEKKVSASRSGDYAPDNASAFNWDVLNAGG